MPAYFRVMVKGEDHQDFCYADDIPESRLDEKMDEAEEAYPDADDVWVERMEL